MNHYAPRAILCAVPLLLLLAMTISAQDLPSAAEPLPRAGYGVYGDFNLNFHTADFRAIPGVPNCCPQFESGSGTGFSAGVLYEMPLAGRLLLDLRAGYGAYDGVLKRIETTAVDREGTVVTGEFEHTIDATIGTIGLEPLLGYRLFGGLTVHLGARAAYVLGPAYAQKEVLTQPSVGTFAGTNSRVRNQFAGDLPGASAFSVGLLGGLSYELPMNRERTLLLEPEVLYNLGLTNVVDGLTWRVSALRAGVAVKYSLRSPEPIAASPAPPVAVETSPARTTPAGPAIAAAVRAAGVRDDGVEEPRATLRVEEFLSTRLRPLLNYVFFDESSSALPDRYRRLAPGEAAGFRVEKLYNEETMPTYYHILNIIGRRMVEHPEASIAIVGCNDDGPAERGKAGLSRSRAVAVRDYLRDAWGIADARMSVESRGLPSKPSNIRDADGVVENRRAEIYSDTWDIIAPVVTRDTLRSANPPVIRFHNDVRSSARVAGWTLTAVQRGRSLRTFTGEGNVPESVDWRIDDDQASIPRAGDSVAYRLEVSDSNGVKASASSSLPIEQVTVQRKRRERIADREIDRFSLILFDFDKSDLNETNKRIVGLVSGYIKPTSTVTIVGHTDRMGEDEYNGRLSRERAAMAARALGAAAESARGVGESAALYDNGLPEGRFYNRTVEILVETPVDSY